MRKYLLAFSPLLAMAFLFSDDKCGKTVPPVLTPAADGPYVLYHDGKAEVNYIADSSGVMVLRREIYPEEKKDEIELAVATDEPGKAFTVRIRKKIQEEKAEFRKADKQFIVSDIEGNFGAFRKLLLSGAVIDSNYNWTFGNGHLVLAGDFFDRGSQVVETLWLIYSLEEKAKAAGGYVHFVLGNHEIMNLSGDLRYLHPKYASNAAIIGKDYMTLFGPDSELGRWLRTKNIAEKVGDILFVHGGISAPVNSTGLSAEQINKLARPWYADTTYNYKYKEEELLMNDNGPFWYRGYYTGSPRASMAQLDSSLQLFNVHHIVTGHTIIADTISRLFDGKLFDTDVHHAGGKSEALLLTGGRFYRVTATGEKRELR